MKKRGIDFGLIAIGTLFLFNPKVAVVDVLPDFIGYLLIMAGIDRTAMMSTHMERAKSGFLRMILISVAETVFALFTFTVAGANERGGFMLLGAFAVGFFECVFTISPWNNFFDGLAYSGYRERKKADGSETDGLGKIRRATKAFFVIRAVLTLLPELSMLTVEKGSDGLYEFIFLFRFFAVSIAAIVGIVWLVRTLIFLKRTSKQDFVAALAEKFTAEILPRRGLFVRRSVRLGFALVGIGFCFATDLISDAINLTPDVIGAVFVAVGLAVLKPHVEKWLPGILLTGAWGASSVARWVANFNYINKYSEYYAASQIESAYQAYTTVKIWSAVEAALFLAAFAAVCSVARYCIVNHAGYSMKIDGDRGEDKIAEIRKSLTAGLIIAAGFAVLSAGADVAYTFTQPTALNTFFEAMPVIKFCADAAFAELTFRALYNVRREVEYKYMLS